MLEPGAAGRAGDFAAALSPEHRGEVEWWWLLDGAAIPAPDALQKLVAPLDDLGPLPAPILLASTVVGRDGQLDPARAPWPRLLQKEVSLDACQRHLVSVRAARHGSLLVHRRAIERHGPPRADYVDDGEDLEWTARMLRGDESGFLVPASRAVLRSEPGAREVAEARHRRDVRNRVNMLRGEAWDGEEKLWFGFLLAQDIIRGVGQGPAGRGLLGTVRAITAGLRLPAA